MASRSRTAELAAFLKRFARHENPYLRIWVKSLRIGTGRTLYGAWTSCANGASMLLVLGADLRAEDLDSEVHRRLVLAVCACARLALVHVPPSEPRPAQAIEIVERWARNDPSADLVEAERIANAAADANVDRAGAGGAMLAAGGAVWWAAWTAGATDWAARGASWVAQDAAQAARGAAMAARRAVAAQGASEAEVDAAHVDALAQCADLVRGVYPRPPYRDPEDGSIDEATYWLQIVDDPSVDPAVRQAAGSRVLEIEAEIQGG